MGCPNRNFQPTNQIETTFPHLGIGVVVSTLQCGLGDLFGELGVESKILEDEASHMTQKLEESKRTGPPTPQRTRRLVYKCKLIKSTNPRN